MTKTEFKNERVVDPRRLRQYSPVWRLTASLQPWFQTHSTHPLHWAARNTVAQIRDYCLPWILTYLTIFTKIYAFIETWVRYRKQRILTLPTIILPYGSIYLINILLDWTAFEYLIFKTEFELLTWVSKNNSEFWLGVRIKCQNIFLSGPKHFMQVNYTNRSYQQLTGYKIKIFINSEKCKLCSISGSIKYSAKI